MLSMSAQIYCVKNMKGSKIYIISGIQAALKALEGGHSFESLLGPACCSIYKKTIVMNGEF